MKQPTVKGWFFHGDDNKNPAICGVVVLAYFKDSTNKIMNINKIKIINAMCQVAK